MRVAVCEDNDREAEILKTKIENYMPLSCLLDGIDIFPDGESLLASDEIYSLVFIDCNLPDMSGVDTARRYKEQNRFASVIFVTAYLEYATDGYELDALRYLLKPVENEKIAEALVAFENKIKKECTVEISGVHTPVYVKSSEIMYIESLGKKTIVRLQNESIESTKSLDVFEREMLSDLFFRTRRQFIVNMKYIMRKEKDHLVMKNGEIVTVSRRKLADFNRRYLNYLKYVD